MGTGKTAEDTKKFTPVPLRCFSYAGRPAFRRALAVASGLPHTAAAESEWGVFERQKRRFFILKDAPLMPFLNDLSMFSNTQSPTMGGG
jgi:hypothetical protein